MAQNLLSIPILCNVVGTHDTLLAIHVFFIRNQAPDLVLKVS